MCKALGDPTRLRIIEFLQCCPQCGAFDEKGRSHDASQATVGEVCCSIFGSQEASSKLSFHLKELRQAGLIHMERKGKFVVCSVQTDALQELAAYLSSGGPKRASDCCHEGTDHPC